MPERDARLVVVTPQPFNAETPLEEHLGLITPNELHYVRDHFALPAWERLTVDGEVERPLTLGLEDLLAMPRRALVVTLECAGNGRAYLDPPVAGEQWRLGAVGTAEWTGVPLRHVLELAEPRASAVEILFAGADAGEVAAVGGARIAFERSLPVARALADDVLLAFAMNGVPLPADHGAPVRLVVPGAYGMASVKWLARVAAVARPFRGFYQAERYVADGAPLPPMAPRAVITSPAEGAMVSGAVRVAGYCWSGGAPIARVDLSVDGGRTWSDVRIAASISPHAWRMWEHEWATSGRGEASLVARAWTADGEGQPLEPHGTDLGYLNNAARPVTVRVG